ITEKLQDSGVTTVKIANRNVTREKIAIGGVGYQELDPSLTEEISDIAIQMKFQDVDAKLAETEEQIVELVNDKADKTSLAETNQSIEALDNAKMDKNTTDISVVQINR